MHFTTVLGVRRSLFALRVAQPGRKFAFYHSFGRPTITFCVKGRSASSRICTSPQFWASDEHEVTRGLSPAATYQTYPAEKKRRNFKEEQHFRAAFSKSSGLSSSSQQIFSAAFLSSSSQQPLFSAAFLSTSSQQLFSADFSAAFLSSSSQQLFSAAFLSSLSQQLFSADFLSRLSQQLFSGALLSSFSQQLFSAAFLSSSSQQLFSAAFLSSSSQQLFSAIILLWSGVGGRLVTSSSAALLGYHLAVVRGWWSASNIILLWSRVGGQVCYRSVEGPFRNALGKK